MLLKPQAQPEMNEITMVSPIEITDLGVYVNLLEYNDLKGLIVLKDLAKKRFRSIKKVIRIGKSFPAQVISIDSNKGYISLSKKEVSDEESKEYEETYKTYKYIYDLVNSYTKRLERNHEIIMNIQDVYKNFIWPLSTDPENLVFILKSASRDFERIYKYLLGSTNDIQLFCFKEILVDKFHDNEVTLETIMEITCFEPDGIKIIKNALIMAQELATNEFPYIVKLIKAPYYSIILKTKNQNEAIKIINNSVRIIQEELDKYGASFKLIKMPEAIIEKEYEPPEKIPDFLGHLIQEESDEDSILSSRDSSLVCSLGDSAPIIDYATDLPKMI